jgi:hypothetical protein
MPTLSALLAPSAFLLALLCPGAPAAAQRADGLGHVAVVAGPVNYDLSGTGWSWGAGARIDLPVARVLTFEGALTYFQYDPQFDGQVRYLFPEVGAHLVLPTPVLRPYLLAGAGAALSVSGGGGTDVAVHAGVGVRTGGDGPYGGRIEGRFRNITLDANASLIELFVGLSRRW